MKTAIIPRVEKIIDWSKVNALAIDAPLHGKNTDVKAWAQIGYDDEALHLRLSAKEGPIRAEEFGPIGTPCSDSCLEFFFCPVEGDKRYFNFEFNPNLCLYLGMGTGLEDLTRLIPEEEEGNGTVFTFRPICTTDSETWSVTYRIPYSFIRRFFPDFTASSGKRIRANFYACSDMKTPSHYLCWNLITRVGAGVFHTPDQFGELTFE